jgi:hypothetical protein
MILNVKRGIDLRLKLSEKQDYARANTLTVLVNNSHTVAHGVLPEAPDMLIRLSLPGFLKGTSDKFLHNYIYRKIEWLTYTKAAPSLELEPREADFHSPRRFRSYEKRRRLG